MSAEPAFVIKQAVGALLWSPADGAGQFASLELSEVVMNTRPALELLRNVGSDGFSMLFTLAAAASVDDAGQLVVVGGVERLRALMNWKRDKAQRVFRDLLDAGFVARSQGSTIGTDGRRHFVATVLVLHPQLYRPDSPTAAAVAGSGAPPTLTGSSCTARPATGASGSGVPVALTGTGRSGSADESPARTADEISGSGGTGSTHDMDDDEKEHASSSDPGDAAALVNALRSLGFADAERVVANTERTMLVDALQYVLTSTSAIANPGAYLRRLLRSGGVRRPDREQLALQLASTLQPVRVTAVPNKTGIPVPATAHEETGTGATSSGFDPERLDEILAEFDDEHRARLEQQVDEELAGVPAKFRRHASVFAAMRRHQLAKLVGLVDDDD